MKNEQNGHGSKNNRHLGELGQNAKFDKNCAIIVISTLIITSIPGMLIYLNLW